MRSRVEQIASQKFTRRRPDGSVAEWQQEDESAVTSKAEAVAMVQRTIDFWIPKIATDLHEQTGIPLSEAKIMAAQSSQKAMTDMLSRGLALKWGLRVDDFTFDVPD